MKKYFFYSMLTAMMFVASTVLAQTAVSVPNQFVGVWSADFSRQSELPDGLQAFVRIEIKRDGAWIISSKIFAYNQNGRDLLTRQKVENGYTLSTISGVVTAASSVGIVLTVLGETRVYDRLSINDNKLFAESMSGVSFLKGEPQVRKQ